MNNGEDMIGKGNKSTGKPDHGGRAGVPEKTDIYRVLAETAQDYIFIIGADLRVRYVNTFAAEAINAKPDEVIGKPVTSLFPPPVSTHVKANLIDVINTGQPKQDEQAFEFLGQTVWLDSRLVPLKRDGAVHAVLGISRDVTEQMTSRLLSISLNELNEMIISTMDFDEICRRTIIGACRVLGAESAAIGLICDSSWQPSQSTGIRPKVLKTRFSAKNFNFLRFCLETKKPLVVPDTSAQADGDAELARLLDLRGFVAAPIATSAGVIGLMLFNFHTRPARLRDMHVDFTYKLTTTLALAFQNIKRYREERNIAAQLQETLLTMPARISNVDFNCAYSSSTEDPARVGGDFYDIFEIAGDKIGIVVGDVSGKGLTAATSTALTKDTIRAYALTGNDPAAVMQQTNSLLCRTKTQFITAFFGIIDPVEEVISYCSAGHPPPLLFGDKQSVFLTTDSPALGIFSDLCFLNQRHALHPSDTVLLYTDGVLEARRDGELFGFDRLKKLVDEDRLPRQELARAVFAEVSAFANKRLFDDVALMAVTLTAKGAAMAV